MHTNLAAVPDPFQSLNYTYQSGALELEYCPEYKILHLHWSNKLNRQDLEEGFEVVFKYIQAFKPKKYLLDLHRRDKIAAENQTWFFEHIIPKILDLTQSTTFLAAIVPVEYYSNLTEEFNMESLLKEEELLVIDHFLLPDMGLNWLKSL